MNHPDWLWVGMVVRFVSLSVRVSRVCSPGVFLVFTVVGCLDLSSERSLHTTGIKTGALAAPPAVSYASAARAFISPTAFEQARGGHGGGALGAGGGLRRLDHGWRQGRVRWGWPHLSRPRGAVGSGPAAVESAAVSGFRPSASRASVRSCGCVVARWVWMDVRFVCVCV